jgi:hypothetical protein
LLTSNQFSNTRTNSLPEYLPQSSWGRRWWLAGPFVALIAMLLFGLTRFGQFQGIDLTMLAQLRGNKRTIGDTLGFFFSDWGLEGRYYAPLPRLFFYLEYRFFVLNPVGWHLVSAALHAISTTLVWGLAWRLTRRPALALCAGLFFAVMPVHVQVVAQPTGQAELLATIYCLASALTFVVARQQPEKARVYYLISLVCYFLALLCKQTAIALPLALLVYDFVTGGLDRILHQESQAEQETNQQGMLSALVRYHAPFFGLLALYLALHFVLLGGLSVFLPTGLQRGELGDFLRGNLRQLVSPFALGGTDGLIMLAALGAFLTLTGVQEWEIWRINNWHVLSSAKPTPKPASRASLEPDDEMDELYTANGVQSTLSEAPNHFNSLTSASTATKKPAEDIVTVERPAYWTLRVAGYGFLWAGVFLLPFVVVLPNPHTLYLASVGFALFLAAALAPFGSAGVAQPNQRHARSLFGFFELSFWLRLGAILAVVLIAFATSVNNIDGWNTASKAFQALLGSR